MPRLARQTGPHKPLERLGRAIGPLSDHAAEAIRQHIISGDYPVGTWLPGERELSEELGVSRVAVREALKMLEANGLLRAHPGRGRLVTGGDDGRRSRVLVDNWLAEHRTEVDHLCEIRAAIEGLAVAGIPPRSRAEVARRLRRLAGEGRAALLADDNVRAAELDAEFHTVLCTGTPNQPLRDLARGLIASAMPAAIAVYAARAAADHSLDQHLLIADHVESGAVRSAQATLRRHHMQQHREAEREALGAAGSTPA